MVLDDVREPSVVAHDLAEAARELDSRRVEAAAEVASGSAWMRSCQGAEAALHVVAEPPRAVEPVGAPQVALW